MARPQKNNAAYFPHDAGMRNDPKVKALRRKFKHAGYSVWNYMLETLTDSDDFILEWSDINIEILSGDYDVDMKELVEIIEYCVRLGLLQKDGDKIMSKNHKERFAPLLQKRDRNRKNKELRTTEISNDGVMDVHNPPETTVSDIQNTHSKVKKSKVKESKVKESKEKEDNIHTHTKNNLWGAGGK